MGRRRTGVNKVRDIIRYGQTTNLSERQIARALGISRTVVARTLQTFRASGLEYPAVEQLADSQLQENLERGKTPQDGARYTELAERFPEMLVELKKKGVTLQWLWEGYIHENPQGYQYSQYCLHFHRWCRSEEVSMHIEYKAGEAMLVDWAGDKLQVINGLTGQNWALDQFVAILGASELTYVEARESQEEAQWIRANEGAFRYFGGVTSALIPDNLKTAVIRSDPYEPGPNPFLRISLATTGWSSCPRGCAAPGTKLWWKGRCAWSTRGSARDFGARSFTPWRRLTWPFENFWRTTIAEPSAVCHTAGGSCSSGWRGTPCVRCPRNPS